jgi:hypothetical protein
MSVIVLIFHIFRDAYWPGGVLAEEYPERSESVKLRTRVTAKTMMLGSLPGLTSEYLPKLAPFFPAT